MITLGNGGFGLMIPLPTGSPMLMEQRRPRDFREGALFLQLVRQYWPVVRNEDYIVFAITEQSVHDRCAENFIQNMRRPGRNFGVFSENGVDQAVNRRHGNGGALVRGHYLPHAIILHMINRRTHHNVMRQDGFNSRLLTGEERNTYAEVPALYDVAANDDPVFIPFGQQSRLG